MFRELCGDAALKNVVIVTNMWGDVSLEDGEDRENQLSSEYFRSVLNKGTRMVRHHNTVESAHDIIRMIMGNRPVVLQIQRELVNGHMAIGDTAAGEIISRELNEQRRRHQAELTKIQEGLEKALMRRDEEAREELEEERRKLQDRMEEIVKSSEGMNSDYAAERERLEAKMEAMEREREGWRDLVCTIPIYKCVFEPPAFSSHLEIFLNGLFSATGDENGCTSAYPPERKVSTVRAKLLKAANRGDKCVCCYFLLTSLFISMTVRCAYTSRLSLMGQQKGSS